MLHSSIIEMVERAVQTTPYTVLRSDKVIYVLHTPYTVLHTDGMDLRVKSSVFQEVRDYENGNVVLSHPSLTNRSIYLYFTFSVSRNTLS